MMRDNLVLKKPPNKAKHHLMHPNAKLHNKEQNVASPYEIEDSILESSD